MSERKSGDQRGRRLFDLRSMIGGLLVLYGVVLVIVGLTDGPAEIARASGIRINLWTGIGMLVVGLLFLAWQRFGGEDSRTGQSQSQLSEEIEAETREQPGEEPRG